ncbi:MAG: hypothetical protein OCU22_08230 [Canidatus Methanoxibalbensis ujae]|nr:hypothetical protein [Candidatus Methanoxibalbensis ujae]
MGGEVIVFGSVVEGNVIFDSIESVEKILMRFWENFILSKFVS